MKYILLITMALMFTGCAEMGLYDSKADCYERGAVRVRNTPNGYPCNCCPMGQ